MKHLLFVGLFSIGLSAQIIVQPAGGGNGLVKPPSITGAQLALLTPSAYTGVIYTVTDGPLCAGGGTGPAVTCTSNGTAWVTLGAIPNPLTTVAIQDKGGQVYNARAYGMLCDGVTDDTAALNTLLATIRSAGGGTVFVQGTCEITSGTITPVNDGASPPNQVYIRVTGSGVSANGYWNALPTSPAALDMRFNAPVGKFDTRGAGILEIDHLTLMDGGSDCATFVHTTNTTLRIHDTTFSGTASLTSACNDAIVLGGTDNTVSGLATGAFQGYGTVIQNNFADKIRRFVLSQEFSNNNVIAFNTISKTCGTNITLAVTAATNANPAVLTVASLHGIQLSATGVSINFSGFTGSWAPLNGVQAVTIPTDSTHLTVTGIDSSGFGAMTGTPSFIIGAAIEIATSVSPATVSYGNYISGNLVEAAGYAFAYACGVGCNTNTFIGNGQWDPSSTTIGAYRVLGSGNMFYVGHSDTTGATEVSAANSSNIVVTPSNAGGATMFPWIHAVASSFGSITSQGTLTSQGNIVIPSGLVGGVPSIYVSGNSTYGIYFNASTGMVMRHNGVDVFGTGTNRFLMARDTNQCWGNAGFLSTTCTTGIAQNTAGVLEINNGTPGTFRDLTLRNQTLSGTLTLQSVAFASLGAVPAAGISVYCNNCTLAATCAGSGTGHLAVSNGTNWTCQ